jgi:hypothetical protein
MRALNISVPKEVDFADLQLRRHADGVIAFNWRPIEAICAASGIDHTAFCTDDVAAFIVAWYGRHLAAGGARDATADDLITEVAIEEMHGQAASHEAGRA